MAWPGPFKHDLARLTAFGLWLTIMPAIAEEPVLARVLSVESNQVTLSLEDRQAGEAGRLIVPLDTAGLPPGIAPGSLVRLWPGSAPGPGGASTGARLVPLDRDLTEHDRTGVRARLMHGAERGFGGGRGGH